MQAALQCSKKKIRTARQETPQHWRARVVMNTGVKLILHRVVCDSKTKTVAMLSSCSLLSALPLVGYLLQIFLQCELTQYCFRQWAFYGWPVYADLLDEDFCAYCRLMLLHSCYLMNSVWQLWFVFSSLFPTLPTLSFPTSQTHCACTNMFLF